MTRLEQAQSNLQKKQKEYFALTAKATALANKIGSLQAKLACATDKAWVDKALKALNNYNKDYTRMQNRLQTLGLEINKLRCNIVNLTLAQTNTPNREVR